MLYIVATPIGNLADISQRAIEVLSSVDCIAAEDTRVSQKLLSAYNIKKSLISYHDFSDDHKVEALLKRMLNGEHIALISDAGTPLISDPGYALVSKARQRDVEVIPVPGVSAVTAALSVSGIACDKFIFEGFLPAKTSARKTQLQSLAKESRALVFYEAPHRLLACLQDMQQVFGGKRKVFLAREITKRFETYKLMALDELCSFVEQDENQQRGECVLVVEGAEQEKALVDDAVMEIAKALASELPPKKAAALAAKITGSDKREIYTQLVQKK